MKLRTRLPKDCPRKHTQPDSTHQRAATTHIELLLSGARKPKPLSALTPQLAGPSLSEMLAYGRYTLEPELLRL